MAQSPFRTSACPLRTWWLPYQWRPWSLVGLLFALVGVDGSGADDCTEFAMTDPHRHRVRGRWKCAYSDGALVVFAVELKWQFNNNGFVFRMKPYCLTASYFFPYPLWLGRGRLIGINALHKSILWDKTISTLVPTVHLLLVLLLVIRLRVRRLDDFFKSQNEKFQINCDTALLWES